MKIGLRLERAFLPRGGDDGGKETRRKGTSNNEIQEGRARWEDQVGKKQNAKHSSSKNNSRDKRRQRQLKVEEIEERRRGGKENAKTYVGK